jgi:hypothetical protein
MDLAGATNIVSGWLDLELELHRLTRDPGTPGHPRERILAEWLPLFVSEDTWDGDAPFTMFQGRLEPLAHQADQADGLARLGRRTLFKVERWTAPDVRGVARCLIGRQNPDWAGKPEYVVDVAELGGSLRVVAMHNPHSKCGGTGTLLKTGAACDLFDRGGRPCLDGLIFLGGLSYDGGELVESNRLEAPATKRWNDYMER